MKRELRDRWVAALRSGEYKQGRDQLRTGGGEFCCLGVLCEVTPEVFERRRGGGYYTHSNNIASIALYDVLDDIGLASGAQDDLIILNDDERAPFPVIADWIEANVQVED